MPQTLAIRLACSPRLGGALLVSFGGGVACVGSAMTPWWCSVPACLLALALLVHTWRTQVTRSAGDAVTELGMDVSGGWWLATRRGGARSVCLSSIAVHRWALVVTCRDDGRARYAVFVAPDAVSSDDYRRLSARLRMHAMEADHEPANRVA